MPEKTVKDKVLCYIVRDSNLLVFRHTDYSYEQEPTHFECFWIPLQAAHILQSGQGALLSRLLD